MTPRPKRPGPSSVPLPPGAIARPGQSADPLAAGATARWFLLTLGACLLLRVLASALASNWVWGLDTFRWWPLPLAVVLVALGAAGFLPPVARALDAALERIGAAWQRRPARGDGLVAAALAVIVLLARDPVRFVGDFHLRAGALATDVPIARLFPQAYPLDVFINMHLPRALAAAHLDPALALQIVGALAAGLFVITGLAFLRSAGARGVALIASACVLFTGGYLAHFAGYDKYGPLLLGTIVAATGVMRLASHGRGAWLVGAGTAIAILSSRIGYALLPPALLALALAWRRREARAAIAGAFALSLIVALALLPRTIGVARHLDLATHVPGGAVARSLATPGEPDALMRFADALNLLFLLVPLWPVGVVLLVCRDRARAAVTPRPRGTGGAAGAAVGGHATPRAVARRRQEPVAIAGPVAVVSLVMQLGMLLAFRARQGVARDWDAYCGVALVVALVLCAALIAWWRKEGGASGAAAAITVSLATSIGFWGLHVNEAMALRRIEAALDGRPAWSATARVAALDQLGLRALNLERYDEAARRFETAAALAPNPRFFYQTGLAYLRAAKLDPAWSAFTHAAALDHYAADPWIGLSQVSLARGDTVGAASMLDTALTRNPRDAVALEVRRSLPDRFRPR